MIRGKKKYIYIYKQTTFFRLNKNNQQPFCFAGSLGWSADVFVILFVANNFFPFVLNLELAMFK